MAYIKDEKGVTYDGLIGGSQVKLITKNITITPGTAIKRGAIVTAAGAVVGSGDTAYGVVACDITATDTVGTIYVSGVFNREKLIVNSGDTVTAHENELRDGGIFLSSIH